MVSFHSACAALYKYRYVILIARYIAESKWNVHTQGQRIRRREWQTKLAQPRVIPLHTKPGTTSILGEWMSATFIYQTRVIVVLITMFGHWRADQESHSNCPPLLITIRMMVTNPHPSILHLSHNYVSFRVLSDYLARLLPHYPQDKQNNQTRGIIKFQVGLRIIWFWCKLITNASSK